MRTLLSHRAPIIWLACAAFSTLSCTAPRDLETSGEDKTSSMQVIKHTLENGLTVYLSPNHEEPRFYAEIITRAGSKHDPETNTGLAHYLEHLLFKGTSSFGTVDFEKEKVLLDEITELYEKRSGEDNETTRSEIYERINEVSTRAASFAIPNEMDRTYSDMGGKAINAHTWHEETVYKVDLPANRLRHWAKIESERFANPVFRLFHTELETVYEEKNRSIDNKDRLLQREVNNLLFKTHPYGQQPTLGSIEHLKNPSIKAIEEFYAKHYVPQNMAICISGDIDPKEAIAIIDEHFSDWQNPGPLRPEPAWPEQGLSGREFVQVQYLGEEQLLLAFRTAPRHHEDHPALRLMDMVLDNSVAGLINLNLVEKQNVRAAGCFPQNHNDHGVQFFYGVPKDGQTLEETEKLILAEIDKIKNGEFEDWILPAVINDFKKRQKEDRENNAKRVEMLRDTFLSFVEWEVTERTIEDLERQTKEDIVRVANKYLGPNYVAGYRVDAQHELPSIEKPSIDPLEIDPDKSSGFMKEVNALPFEPFEPKFVESGKDFTVTEVGPGIRLIHAGNPLNDLFALQVRMEQGYRHQSLLPYAKRMLDRSGAGEVSAENLKIEWYKLGTDFAFGVRDRLSSFSLSGLDENLESSLDLAYQLMRSPNISPEKWEESKKIILAERDDEQKDPRSLSNALAHFHRYGEKSRFLDRPSDAELNATSVDGLSKLLKDVLQVERTILYYGPRSPEEVLASIKDGFLGKEPGIEVSKVEPVRSLAPEKSQVFFLQKEMAQAQVRLEFAVGTYDENKTPAGQLFNEYFGGGMAGLVFQELREARALAYSAWAHFFSPSRPNDENILIGAIGCQADKTLEAVEAFLGLLEEMPINQTRWESAHSSLLSTYRTNPIGYRSTPGFVYDFGALGLEGDPRKARFKALRDADMNLLKEFYEKEIKPKAKLLSIVGDSARIDLDKLSEFGPVKKVTAEDLFNR